MRSSTSSGAAAGRRARSVRIRCALCEPTRHGTHLPHDSLRKKRSTFVAAASRSVPSASTTTAPEPSIDPASASGSKSSGTSSPSGPEEVRRRAARLDRAELAAAGHPAGELDQLAGRCVPIGTQ